MPERIPEHSTRIRRAFDGINKDFVPYTGAISDVDLGAFNFITTGTITGQLQMGQNLSPTYTTVQHWSNTMQSASIITGGLITDSGSGQVDVSAATGIIKTTASDIGANVFFNYAGDTNFVLTNNDLNFLYLTYVDADNAPTLAVTLDDANINEQTEILLGWVYREDNVVHILNLGGRFENSLARQQIHDHEVHGFERATGLVLSTDASRNVLYTEGIVYSFITRFTIQAFDSSGASRFSYFYRASPSGWTEVTNQSVINNANYDDGDGTLGTLTSNRYGVHWVYAEPNGHTYILYGWGDYKRAEAEDASPPSSVPFHVHSMCILIGKIIVKEGTNTTTVASAFDIKFTATGVDDHNDLSNLQGGSADQYYHLTAAELAEIAVNTTHSGSVGTDHGYIDQDLQTTASPTFVNLTLGGEINNLTLLEHDADSWSIAGGSGPIKTFRVYASCSIDQNLHSSASPTFAGLTVGGFTGILVGTAGAVSASSLDNGTVGNIVFTHAAGVISAVTQDGEIDHNALNNYVADQHVAHTGVTIATGDGLTGGGTIAASRTFAVDLATNPGLEIDTAKLRVKVKAASGITRDADGLSVAMPAFRAYLGSNQTVGSGAEDQIEIDTITYDTDSGFNTGTFLYVIPETGHYSIGCLLAILGTADAGKVFYIIIKKDSADVLTVEKFIGSNMTNRFEASIDVACTVGEEIEFWTYHDMGVNKLVYSGVATTEIWGHRFR